ncbi:MAG TPA: response regulator transcription factor [Oligoflexia bacterium]|nr:response regulator transcription factor [Oligoflexia bacterium]
MAAEGTSVKILIIEDDQAVREGLVENLKLEGYAVVARDNGVEGLEAFDKESPDLVILDLMMPRLDGLEVCRRIRESKRATPIMILTAKCSEVDKVVGLELGADDYLTKPFGMRELFARLKALLRRVNAAGKSGEESSDKGGERDDLVFGDVAIDFRTYRARKGEKEIMLSAKEFELLRYLSNQPDIPVSRDELLDHVWGYNNYPTTRTVDNFIARLRQKIEDSPDRPRHLMTVHGVGYKFVL